MKITGFNLHNRQKEIFKSIDKSNAKYFIINASRQSGKTTLLKEMVRYFALTNESVQIMFVTPTYALGSIIFLDIIESVLGIPVIKSVNKSNLIIEFINKSKVLFKSAERYDSIRGLSNDYVFLDEFSYFKYESWAAIKPTVAAKKDAKVIITSTPKGRNLFYDLAQLGKSNNDRYEYYFMHYTNNPLYDQQEVDDAKLVLGDNSPIYLAEYEGVFIEDGGTVFKNVLKNQTIKNWIEPAYNNKYYAGLDIGKEDSTVLTIMDKDGNIMFIKSIKQKSYNDIINELVHILKKYSPIVYLETNGVGSVFFDILVKQYTNLIPWTTTNQSKTEIIELLVLALNTEAIKLPTKELYKDLDFEFSVFTYEYSPKTRIVKYMAQTPHHDDNIISLALANKCRLDNNRGFVMKPGQINAFRR